MLVKITKSEKETKKFGKELAEQILKRKIKKRILILKGDLGGGKTTFLKGFAKGLGIKKRILSPTFVLMRKFKIKPQTSNFEYFYHFDCYRVKKTDLLKLGLKEILKDKRNILAFEWGEKLKKFPQKETLSIEFEFLSPTKRKIKISL